MGYVEAGGYDRDMNYIDDRVVEHPEGGREWPVEAGRYRLVGSRACPWAHRAIITRRLVGLDVGPDAGPGGTGPAPLSQGLCGPTHDWKSWTFDLDVDSVDPVLGVGRLRDCYLHRYADYPKGITVPALVEVNSKAVVTNDFRSMVTDLATQWAPLHRSGAPDLYPAELREEIDAMVDLNSRTVNNGVYRCGFAGDQASYEDAFAVLFARLDELEEHLATRRYLVGEHVTLADVYLFVTLVRFDHVYHGHFKCNRNRIAEMPNLWGYLRDLFQTPGIGDTVNLDHIKQHYYRVHADINPTGVVAVGPDPAAFYTPHDRERLGGTPFWNAAGNAEAPAAPRPEDIREGDEAGAFA
ncbi:MAG: glutathione S-transferase family protein [Corynebacterium variabile]|uniref:glutathione S-transferase family protein n=1 Tax=Corynebacterium variabile TaxID=1727 RepID=UPI003F929F32